MRALLLALFALLSSCTASKPMLDSPDPGQRRKSIIKLTPESAPKATDALLKIATSDPDPDVQLAALGALGMTGDARVIPVLAARIADSDEAGLFREAALRSLVTLGTAEAGQAVIKTWFAIAEDDGLRPALIRALGSKHPEWLKALRTSGGDPARIRAVEAEAPAWMLKKAR